MAGGGNTKVQEFFSVRFRRLLSGAPDGKPPWLDLIAAGDEPGLFTPDDAPWLVHADFGTLVGGIRALLVQALQPATLAGVADHSRYKEDPLGRLAGTIRWLTVTTFGSHRAIASEASRVNRLHERVKGEYESPRGAQAYRAADPNLLLWVHVAFMDSFLTCHQLYSSAPIPGGADAYISQWARSVEPLGLNNAPLNQAQLDATMAHFFESGQLVCNERTREVVSFIRKPPLTPFVAFIYRLLFAAAVVSLRPEHRELLGLKLPPRRLITGLTRFTLRAIRFIIGPESPIEEAGRNRLVRIGAWKG